jgi:hypothetical protein
MKRKGKKD